MESLSKYAVAFPARDAFYHGLSASFYDEFETFRKIYDMASSFIGENLHEISYKNPEGKPQLHTVCLITHCYALYRVLEEYFLKQPSAAIGFSQGEFTAVASGGVLAFPNILKLIYDLELLLASNEKIISGTMERVFGLDREKLYECCHSIDPDKRHISLGICLSNDQNVISGVKEKILKVSRLAKENGARWVISLGSGGSFHSPLCLEILGESDKIFDTFAFSDSDFPIYSCADGSSSRIGKQIKKMLSKQIAMPILWDTIISNLKMEGINKIIELGPGCTISGNTRIIDPSIESKWINNVKDLSDLLKSM